MKKAAFCHLLVHYRFAKKSLHDAVMAVRDSGHCVDNAMLIAVIKPTGALECLYWQALGNGEVNLAKGINRTIEKAKHIHGITQA